MEINRPGRTARARRAAYTAGFKSGGAALRTGSARNDRVQLSPAGLLAAARKKGQTERLDPFLLERQYVESQKENAEARAKTQAKAEKAMRACAKIAGRIRDGDQVPPEDLEYLLKNGPTMYKLAMTSRVPKEDPEKWDSAIPPEEKAEGKAKAASEDAGVSGPEASAAPPAGGNAPSGGDTSSSSGA